MVAASARLILLVGAVCLVQRPGPARAEGGDPHHFVVVATGGVGQLSENADPLWRAWSLGLDATWKIGRAALGLAFERTSQFSRPNYHALREQVLAHAGYRHVYDDPRWSTTFRLMLGRFVTTVRPELAPFGPRTYQNDGPSFGPSLVIDRRCAGWLTVGAEARATFQLELAENPAVGQSLLLLLHAGVDF